MLGLTDNQLTTVMDMARTLPVEKRDLYLQRIAAMLTVRGRGHFNDSDVHEVTTLALCGLIQQTADAPAATARAAQAILLKFSAKLTHHLFGVRVFSRSV